MDMYLVERYVPGTTRALAPPRAGTTGQDRRSAGPVRHVLSALIPGDEICLSLFEAPSRNALAEALGTEGTPFIRIVDAVVQDGGCAGPGTFLRPDAETRMEGAGA